MFKGIDFYSDTMTRPTSGMRQAIASAEVGDEQKGEDPTTQKLESRVADLLGKSSALFFPCATMANEIAIMLHCEPGDELIADSECHLFFAETGGPAIHAGVIAKGIETPDGTFTGDDVRKKYRLAKGSHYPVTKLVSVENTTNMGGGVAWPLDKLDSVLDASQELGLKTHLDGSRLFNALAKLAIPAKRATARFDTITICLSKALGCPTGAVLAFDKAHWPKVRRLKQLMGGAMRQSGILAAAGIYALDNHLDRIKEDHDNARQLAESLCQLSSLKVETPNPSTNMVFFHWINTQRSVDWFLQESEKRGVRFSAVGGNRIRAVTHLDISTSDIDRAFQILKEIAN